MSGSHSPHIVNRCNGMAHNGRCARRPKYALRYFGGEQELFACGVHIGWLLGHLFEDGDEEVIVRGVS